MRKQPELSVEMWFCGDDECHCLRPVVCVRYPFDEPKPGVGIYEQIAQGPFVSYGYGADDPEKDRKEQKRWLSDAERWYKTRHVCAQCAPKPDDARREP